jgi:membrane-bound metal-dependent hydrolase YbcI (DUF457 family)
MPEPSIHVSAVFALLTYMGFGLPTSVALAAMAVLPDLDVLVRTHRSVTHSLVVYSPIALAAMLSHSVEPGLSIILFGVWISLSSHVLLDVIGGYCPALWPILKEDLMVSTGLKLEFGHSFALEPFAKISRRPMSMSPFEQFDASVVTGEGLLISAMLIILSLPRLPPL